MITKEKALDALNKIRNPMFPVAYDALHQYIEETADLRRQLAEAQAAAEGANTAMLNYRAEALEAQARLAELDGERYEQLEREHLGDAEKQTGIYFTSPADQKDAVRVPDGWKLVPIEPTLAMIDAGAEVDPERASVWDSMLAAAPDAAMLSASQGGKCGELLDGEDSPFPGMASAFESYYGQSWKDRDWRRETSIWSAAWKAALSVTPPDSPAHRPARNTRRAVG